MAAFNIAPPEPFLFTQPENWEKWIRRFDRFRKSSGLAEKPEPDQVNTLIYSMGDQAEDILLSFRLSEEEAKKYSTIVENFQQYFVKRKNVIYERSKFNQRIQKLDETVDSFVTDLYRLARTCNYDDLTNEMIRDRIMAGIRDGAVVERLQMDPELTLEKAIQMTRESEMLKSQQSTVRAQQQEQSGTMVDYVESKHKLLPAKSNPHYKSDSRSGRCGRTFHPPYQCPARDAVCRKCLKKGHFQHMCRSKSVAMVTTENTDYEFLGAVTSSQVDTASVGGQPWMVRLQMNNQWMKFKIDSGADVTVIAEADYLEARDGPLQSPTTILRGPSSIPLSVSGKFRGQLQKGD